MPLVLDGDTGIVGVLLTDANGNVTFDTNTLYVDAPNNRVGIGTTSPLSGFHISDGTNAGSPQNASRKATLMIDAGATASADLQFMVRNGYNSHIFFGDAADPNVGMLWYDHSTNHMNFSANTNHAMTIDDNGRVGIGSTNPGQRLTIEGAADNTNSEVRITATGVASGYLGADSNGFNIGTDTAGLYFKTGVTGGQSVGATGTARMVINSSGQVGIGTTNPGVKLDVAGEIASRASSPGLYLYDSNVTNLYHRIIGGGNAGLEYSADVNNVGAGYHRWDIGPNTRMYLTEDGNLGIGILSPFSKLQVGGHTFDGGNGMYNNSRVGISNHGNLTGMMLASTYNDTTWPEYGLVFVQGPTTSNYNVWSISPEGPALGDSLHFIYGSNATNIHTGSKKVTFDGNGNVGIGTASPSAFLDVVSNSASGYVAEFRESNASNFGTILIDSPTDGESRPSYMDYATGGTVKWSSGLAYLDAARSFHIGTGSGLSNSKVTIDTSGKVGIGTTSPGEKIHVYGSGQQFIKVETTTTGSAAFVGMRMQDGDGDLGSIGDFGSGRRAFMLDTGSGVDMMFFTDNQNNSSNMPRMTISSSGKIGINTLPLADTTGTLHVGGGLSVGAGNHAGYHVFSQHEGNVPANTTREVLQFEGPAYARYMTVTISGYLCRKEQYFSGYQSWDGASNGNSVGSTVDGTTTFSNGTNSSDARAKIQLECTAVSGTSGHPRYKLKLITGGVTGQLYDTTVVVKFYNPPFYPTYL